MTDSIFPGILSDPGLPAAQGLYSPVKEHAACGVGFVVDLKGCKTHRLVRDGLTALINLNPASRRRCW